MAQQFFRPFAACAAFALALVSIGAITFVPETVPLSAQSSAASAMPELA